MQFTYEAYGNLIHELKNHKYTLTDYHQYRNASHPCILRHDIDQSPACALELAKIEADMEVHSTYFVLLTSDFYNVHSEENRHILKQIASLGHTIGLHFDEIAYSQIIDENIDSDHHANMLIGLIQAEEAALSNVLDLQVDTVSMHRPSQFCLENDLQIPGMINSYGQEFFKGFKYLSDSRHHWREDVLSYIREEKFDRLHILTHAFWYHQENVSLQDALTDYLDVARADRYAMLNRNFTRLDDALAGRG